MRSERVTVSRKWLETRHACRRGIRYFRDRFGEGPVRLTLNRELMESIPEDWQRWFANKVFWTGTCRPRRAPSVRRYVWGRCVARRDDCGCGFQETPYVSFRCSKHGWYSEPINPMPPLE